MLITSPEQIAVATSPTVRVDVPEWGEGNYVLIGRVTGLQYQQYVDFVSKESSFGVTKSRHAALIAACLRDESGKPCMQPNLSEPLARADAGTLLRLFYVCQKHNQLDDESFEDLKKNYGKIHSNGSACDSPAT
jgi:hypothetical protein